MESYAERLERECKEYEAFFPVITELVDAILKLDHTSNMEFDYHIEKKNMMYKKTEQILLKHNCKIR